MPSRADYKCDQCGCEREFVFDYTPPDGMAGARGKCEHFDCTGTWKRIWTAPHLGRGSNGEPPR